MDGPNDPTAPAPEPRTFEANDRYRNAPGAMLRLGNLPKYLAASVHSGEDVVLTAIGPGSERVRGQMDNTEVFRVMAEALGLGHGLRLSLAAPSPRLRRAGGEPGIQTNRCLDRGSGFRVRDFARPGMTPE